MIVKLAFGRDQLAVDLRGLRVRPLTCSAPPGTPDPEAVVVSAVDKPLQGPSLTRLAAGRRKVCLIVPDATRRADLPRVLPALLGRLAAADVAAHETTILIACGTHPAVGDAAARRLLGAVPDGVRILEHDSRDNAVLVPVGELRPGTPLRLHRAAVECDLLVTVGTVRHHYFAGFGGGPKMVFPGVAGHDEIQSNHALVLTGTGDNAVRRRAGCEPGQLVGNPVAEEIAHAVSQHPPDLAVCLVAGANGGIAWAVAGPWQTSFDAAVDTVRAWYEITAEGPFRLMVTSAGGHPSDSTLIQAHKALDAACRFLAPGGELLLCAKLDDGLGSPAMEPFVDDPRQEAILAALSESWVQYGHTTLRIVEKTSSFRVRLVSDLDPEVARRLGFEPESDPAAVIDDWRARHTGTTVGVMPSGDVFPRT